MSENVVDPERRRRRYIIAQPASDTNGVINLVDIAEELRADPSVELLRVVGPEARPECLIVTMTPQKAEGLKERFAARLIVEPDAPLIDPTKPFNVS